MKPGLLPDGKTVLIPTCADCHFSMPCGGDFVECHYNPPRVCEDELDATEGNCAFPVLSKSNSCGKFTRRGRVLL